MKNTNESGRSMVEMLGVLAIIGVLSIGGIAGYTMAMNKYRANEITAAIVHGAILCRTNQTASVTSIAGETEGLATLTCSDAATGKVSYTLDAVYATGSNKAVGTMVQKNLGTTDGTYTPQS